MNKSEVDVSDMSENSSSQSQSSLLNRYTVGSVKTSSLWQSFLWEAMGTALFTIGVITNVTTFGICTAQACAFILVHQMTGAQMNPIVSLNLCLRKKVQRQHCMVNILGQLLGSIIGGLLVYMTNVGHSYSPPTISDGINDFQAFTQIQMGSFFLVMMLSIQLDARSRLTTDTFMFGCFFAMTIFTAQQFAIRASGSLNPALVIGLNISHMIVGGEYVQIKAVWVFLIAPFLGSLYAAIFFTKVFIPTLKITQNHQRNHPHVDIT